MRRWAPAISPFIWSAGRLTRRAEVSARSVSNLNRSSGSVYVVSIDPCICEALRPKGRDFPVRWFAFLLCPFLPAGRQGPHPQWRACGALAGQSRCPQSLSLLLKTISLVIVPDYHLKSGIRSRILALRKYQTIFLFLIF